MPVYVVAHISVADAEAYAAYQRVGLPILAAAGGKIVAGGPGAVLLEGRELGGSNAIVEFASMEAAQAWYHSEAYQQTIPLRTACSTAHLIAVLPGLAD
ncbi:MAG: DUF1330 domain-containing protein [Sporichthyaceae bacterium]